VRAARGVAALQEDAGLADVAQAQPGVALEAAGDQTAQHRMLGDRQGLPVGLGAQHGGQRVADRLALEQPLAGEHLEEDHAEGPDVGAPVDRLLPRACSGLM
jgi:hypothetical protein